MKVTYITKRQPTFFPKDVEVTLEQLKEIFTDKAIKSMAEDGFLEKVYSFKDKLIAEMQSFKDRGTKVMLHELKEDQLDQIIGEFEYLKKKVGDKIALKIEVPNNRQQDVHSFFTSLNVNFTDYSVFSENKVTVGCIYDTSEVLFVTEVVEATISNCLMITEYK